MLEFAAEAITAEGDDGMGAAHGPEHDGMLEAATDYGLATSFDHTGANKERLRAELRIAHSCGIPSEVIGLGLEPISQEWIGSVAAAQIARCPASV